MNLKQENKDKILNIGWNNKDKQIKDNTIIIGTKEYIKQLNKEIEENNMENITLINCFDFEEVRNDINTIINNHDKSLNTLGFNNI